MRWAIVWWIMFVTYSPVSSGEGEPTRRELLAYLLDTKKYDANIVPDFDKEVPTNVSVQIGILDIFSVSETTMDFSVDIFLRQWWRDERLDYSANSSFEVLEVDSKNMNRLWLPDTFFENEKSASVHSVTSPNKLVHITQDGTIISSMRISMTLGCQMRLQLYPFDSQRCPFIIQSYGYTMRNIYLHWYTPNSFVMPDLDMPQFSLGTSEEDIKLTSYKQATETGDFSKLKAEITMTRKVGHHFLHVFLPSTLLVMLSWVSFWVDPKAVPARVSLGVTCVLTMTTQSSGIRQTLPPVSYVKAIDIWMFVCLLFVFLALIEYAYVNMLQRQQDPEVKAKKVEAENGTAYGEKKAKRVDYVSRFIFPGAYVLFLLIFGSVIWVMNGMEAF